MTPWYLEAAVTPAAKFTQQALAYQLSLTKPPGALGVLEDLAVRFSSFQQTLKPDIQRIAIAIMAGDHGIAAEGVSAFPQAVTGEMIKNFATGGAAISVLARYLTADLRVYNTGSVNTLEPIVGVEDVRVAAGTKNFMQQPAMTAAECLQALSIGFDAAVRAKSLQAQLFIGGEMGIANTTSAACIAAKLLQVSPESLAGPGTGLDAAGVSFKAQIIQKALDKYHTEEALDILATFGGFEIAALVGSFIAAAQLQIPVLIDGYIATAAALLALRMNPSIKPWLIASHQSAEPAHGMMLQALGLQPVVSLGMRLGEGSGAAVVVPLLQAACRLQSEMASFNEAGVSEKQA